jgi:hypothetical protein
MVRDSTDDDKGIVSILEDGARKVVHQGVEQKSVPRGREQKLLKDIRNNVEEEGGEGISLPKPVTTLNPSARDTIEQHSSLAGLV